jgi:hypothetical protein
MENPESVAISSSTTVVCFCSRHFLPLKVYFAPLAARIYTEAYCVRHKATEAHSLSFNVQFQSPSYVYHVCHFEETKICAVFILKFLLNFLLGAFREKRQVYIFTCLLSAEGGTEL